MKLKKIILSVLAIAMVITMIPGNRVFAETEESEIAETNVSESPITNNKNCVVEIQCLFNDKAGKPHEINSCSGFIATKNESETYVVTTYGSVNVSRKKIKSFCEENDISYDSSFAACEIEIVYEGVRYPASLLHKNEEENFCILQVQQMENKEAVSFDADYELVKDAEVYLLTASESEYTSEPEAVRGTIAESTGSEIMASFEQQIRRAGGLLISDEGYAIGLAEKQKEDAETVRIVTAKDILTILSNDGIYYESRQLESARDELTDLLEKANTMYADKSYTTSSKEQLESAIESASEICADSESSSDPDKVQAASEALQSGMDGLTEKSPVLRMINLIMLPVLLVLLIWMIYSILQLKKIKEGLSQSVIADSQNPRPYEHYHAPKQSGKKSGIFILDNGHTVTVRSGEEGFYIGREEECRICLSGDGISRKHLKITRSGSGFAAKDVSHTGALLNNEIMEKNVNYILHDGDCLDIQGNLIRFKED